MALSDEFYEELLPEIDEVIDELGTEYEVSTPGGYDPGSMKTHPPTSRPVKGLVADQTLMASLAAAGMTWAGKKVVLLSADAQPQEGESVVIDGVSYPVDKLQEIKPAEITLLYILDITR